MRICFLSNGFYPDAGADTEVVMNTAAALGAAGAEVELVVPHEGRRQPSPEKVLDYYGVRPTFQFITLPTSFPPTRRCRVEKLTHAVSGARYAQRWRADVVLTRDPLTLANLHRLRLPWCLETYRRHAAEKPWLPRLLRRVDLARGVGAVAHNDLSRDDLVQLGFAPEAVLTARVGVANACLQMKVDRDEARRRYGVPSDRPVVGFVGNVQNANGIQDVLNLAACLPEARVMIVGGGPYEVERLSTLMRRRGIVNVLLIGHRPASEAPAYLFAADVLFAPAVYTNSYFRSEWINKLTPIVLPGTPIKLFNYLAAGRPVVAADQPEMHELVRHEHTALLVPPKDAVAAAQAVRRLLAEPQLAAQLVARGLSKIRQFTWEARGARILEFFESRIAARRPKTIERQRRAAA